MDGLEYLELEAVNEPPRRPGMTADDDVDAELEAEEEAAAD